MLRPEPMGWVDIVLEKHSAPTMFEVIAVTELFEPDRPHDPEFGDWDEVSQAGSLVRELRNRIRPYASQLPAPDMHDTTAAERMSQFRELAGDLERRVGGWLEAGKPDLERLSEIEQQRETLYDLRSAVQLLPPSIDLEHWRSDSEARRSYVPVVAYGDAAGAAELLDYSRDGRLQGHFTADEDLAVVRGLLSRDEYDAVCARCRQCRLRVLDIPAWLKGTPEEGARLIGERIGRLDREASEIRDRLARLSDDYRMGGARWLIERQDWLESVLEQAHQGKNFVHLGGWVPRQRYDALVSRLKETGKPFLIRLEGGESHGVSPTMLSNPSWARSFELFVTGFGTPDINEVDPSMILALVTPLMFGYMFGDVGQGLLLVLAGSLLARRLPWIRLLIPAGLSAMVFGFLYGSVFSIEHWIPALWLHPMNEPLVVLGVPLVFGVVLLLLSLAFGGVEARWRGKIRQWCSHNVPLLLCYLAPAVWFLSPGTGLAMVAAAFAVLLVSPTGGRRRFIRRLAALPGALIELLEEWMQLMINTLSFARLGAFSLAHAGLGMALVSLAELPESTISAAVILVVGNLVITALEGLVVSVQTTRLVMFEFFRRFFEGSGRRFQPLTLGGHPGGGENP